MEVLVLIFLILLLTSFIPLSNRSESNKRDVNSNSFYKNTGMGDRTFLKKMLISERGDYCENCGSETELHVHHIIPVSKGGTDDSENLKLLCYNCHLDDHNYEFDEIGEYRNRKVPEKYRIIRDAIKNQKNIIIRYKSFENKKTIREIKPIKIFLRDRYYYLEAFCYLRNDKREFKISRITNIKNK